MTRPAILTESQLRAAVAVAEARADYDEAIKQQVAWAKMCKDTSRPALERGVAFIEHEKQVENTVEVARRLADLADAYRAIRPWPNHEVRSVETLARIVADMTDGGTDPYAVRHDTGLSTILREFEGLEPRDGVR